MASATTTATFHLTHNCNIRCTYCYTGEKFGPGMSRETADRAVDFVYELASEQKSEHVEVVFFGGEPLMKKDILLFIADEFIKRNQGYNLSFKMSTNGLLLTPELLDELLKRRIFISLSLDGDPETHDQQRPDARGEGTASRLKKLIPSLLRHLPTCNANCVVTPESADCVDRSIAWIAKQGFRYISVALDHGNPDWNRSALKKLEASYKRLGEWYERETIAGSKFYLGSFDERIRTRTWGIPTAAERCMPGSKSISIASSGNVFPCVQFVKEDENSDFIIGNIHSGMNRQKAQQFSCQATRDHDECSGCELLGRCASWCACINWQATGQVDGVSALLCEHERLLFPIVDRTANRLWKKRNSRFIHKHYNREFPKIDYIEEILLHEAMHGLDASEEMQ